MPFLTEVYDSKTGNSVMLDLIVSPRASKSQVKGLHGDRLKLQLAAAPVDGLANTELIKFLSALVCRPRHAITIVKGLSSKRKTVRVEGLMLSEARELFLQLLK